jgi:hypothetical protein
MQKLNAREYYVIVLTAILAIIQAGFLFREVFSETSPFVAGEDGSYNNVQKADIINIGNTLLQIILSVTAFSFLLMKRRPGWIAAFSLISFYAFLLSYVMGKAALAGIVDILFWVGFLITAMLLLAIIFLCIPSTLKKFNINKTAIVPVVLILLLLVTIYFVIPE